MKWQDHISSDKEVLAGKPTVKGTRISVDQILELFAQGWTQEQILENYPRLTAEHLKAVFAYLLDCTQDGLLYNIPRRTA